MLWQRAESPGRGLSPQRWAKVPKLLARYEHGMLTSCWVFAVMNDAKQESLFQPLIPSQKVPAIHAPALWNLSMQSCWLLWATVCLILWVLFCKPTWQTGEKKISFFLARGQGVHCKHSIHVGRKLILSSLQLARQNLLLTVKRSLKVQFMCGSYSLHTSLWTCYLCYPIRNFSFCPFLT